MAWNEPGGNRNDQDPWGSGNRGGNQGPPDLDEALRRGLDKLNRLLGGGGRGGSGGSSGGSSGYGPVFFVIAVLVLLFLAWESVYTVDARERGVVLRFGRYFDTVTPGLHYKIPLVDDVRMVQVTGVRSFTTSQEMLTGDENIVDVKLSVQYVINDAKKFVLAVRDPVQTLEYATDSALRHVVGSMKLDEVLTEGRAQLAAGVDQRLQHFLNEYQAGIQLQQVNVEDAQPPKAVQDAFQDVQRAKLDEQSSQEQAQKYRNQVVPEARGKAQRMLEDAQAYKQKVIDQAKGQAARFDKILAAYKQAPLVTRERLYLDTIEQIMSDTSKVLVDTKSSSNLLYLPLDKLSQSTSGKSSGSSDQATLNSALGSMGQSGAQSSGGQ